MARPWKAKRLRMHRGGLCKHENFENFLTQKDWASIRRDGVIKAFVISVIGARSDKLGIINPSERTLNRMVRITAFCLKQYEWDTDEVTECKKLISATIEGYENPNQRKSKKNRLNTVRIISFARKTWMTT